MGDKEWAPETVFDVLGDRLSRRILIAAAETPVSADDVAASTEASLPTVYRRLDALVDYSLLEQGRAVDPDGTQYKTYETAADRIEVDLQADGFAVDIEVDRDLVSQFEAFWGELERATVSVDVGADGVSEHVAASDGPADG